MSRYKVGDEVTIRSDLRAGQVITVTGNVVNVESASHAGRLATVVGAYHSVIGYDYYELKFNGEHDHSIQAWYDELFDPSLSGQWLKVYGGMYTPDLCQHNVKEYFGLNERFNYCTKCGDKV